MGRRGDRTPQSNSASLLIEQVATVLPCRKPTQRDRYGEILEGLPGSKSVARRKRDVRNLGGPMVSLEEGRVYQRNEGHLMGHGESDRSIVL